MDTELLLWLGGFLSAVLLFGAVALHDAALSPAAQEKQPMADDKRPTLTFDFNRNGVPDYQEGWFWSGAWRLFSWGVRTFAAPHTLVFKGVLAAERARAELEVPRTPAAP